MLLIDDILLSPFTSLMWIFREISNAVDKDLASEPAAITAKLGELYMMLETGQLTETEFDAAETVLLDRLDILKERAESEEGADDDDDDDDGEDDDPEDDDDDEDDGNGPEESSGRLSLTDIH